MTDRSNEDLVRIVRAGQRATEKLEVVETGFDSYQDLIFLCLGFLGNGFGDLLDLTDFQSSALKRDLHHMSQVLSDTQEGEDVFLREAGRATQERLILKNGFRATERTLMLSAHLISSVLIQDERSRVRQFIDDRRRHFLRQITFGREARRLVFERNTGLVNKSAWYVAKRMGREVEPLVTIAATEFLHCIDHSFDPDKGKKLSTYGMSCMRAKCMSAVETPELIFSTTSNMAEVVNGVLSGQLPLDASDVKEENREEQAELRRKIWCGYMPTSMDQQLWGGDGACLRDTISDDEFDMDTQVAQMAVKQVLELILGGHLVHEGDRIVAERRLAVGNDDISSTYEEIAALLHEMGLDERRVSRQRIEQRWVKVRELLGDNLRKIAPDMLEAFDV